jgi:uncharacterized protein YfeS
MSEENDETWELSPANIHPNAARILTDEFYWDCVDDNSPFGNDTGADTLHFFHDWREEHPDTNPIVFLDELLAGWEVDNDHWDVVESEQARELLREDAFGLNTRDDAVIAVALGQFALEGRIEPEIKRRALLAMERQALPPLLESRSAWASERVERLGKMRAVVEQQ